MWFYMYPNCRWNSEDLHKEVTQLKALIQAQGSGEEHQMYQQQLRGLSETKSLCKQAESQRVISKHILLLVIPSCSDLGSTPSEEAAR